MTAKDLHEDAGAIIRTQQLQSKTALAMARHILATVKPDDDKPATLEWAMTQIENAVLGNMFRGPDWIPEIHNGDAMGRLACRSTRGQFRHLCRALGIERKDEVSSGQ